MGTRMRLGRMDALNSAIVVKRRGSLILVLSRTLRPQSLIKDTFSSDQIVKTRGEFPRSLYCQRNKGFDKACKIGFSKLYFKNFKAIQLNT